MRHHGQTHRQLTLLLAAAQDGKRTVLMCPTPEHADAVFVSASNMVVDKDCAAPKTRTFTFAGGGELTIEDMSKHKAKPKYRYLDDELGETTR
jgi:hypothetical protein